MTTRDMLPYRYASKDSLGLRLARAVWICFLIAPSLAAIAWTVYPAGIAWWATRVMEPIAIAAQEEPSPDQVVEIKRKVQKHFRSFDLYVPLEDITVPRGEDDGQARRTSLMQKACGKGRLYVWVPLRFRLPFAGDKVYEWCWIPPVKST